MPRDFLEGNQLIMNDKPSAFWTIDAGATVEVGATIQGPVRIEAAAHISSDVVIRGPVTIGERVAVQNAYLGPYTAIGNDVVIDGGEIEHSIVLEGAKITSPERIVDSILGRNTEVTAKGDSLPHSGHRMVIGENSKVEL